MSSLDPIQEKLQLLKQRYQASFPEKQAELTQARARLEAGEIKQGLEQLRHHAHKLAGSGASYGFSDLSAQARHLEHSVIDIQHSGSLDYGSIFIEYNKLEDILKG